MYGAELREKGGLRSKKGGGLWFFRAGGPTYIHPPLRGTEQAPSPRGGVGSYGIHMGQVFVLVAYGVYIAGVL